VRRTRKTSDGKATGEHQANLQDFDYDSANIITAPETKSPISCKVVVGLGLA